MSQYFKDDSLSSEPTPPVQRGAHRSGLAVASLVLGILSVPCFGYFLAPFSIIFGLIALGSINKSKGTKSGTGFAVTGLILSTLSLFFFGYFTYFSSSLTSSEGGAAKEVHRSRMNQAVHNITVAKGNQVGYGNTDEAKALANRFSAEMKAFREQLFTSSSKGMSFTNGNFLTHCEINEGTCVFLVHVPKLRKFDSESKRNLCDLAWMVAQNTLAESSFPEGGELAVGVRGLILYEKILLGKFQKNPESPLKSVESRTDDDIVLKKFFPEPKKEPAPVSATLDQKKQKLSEQEKKEIKKP